MTCSIYKADLTIGRRYLVANLAKHTEMSQWLRAHGEQEYVYEIWRDK
jgi:hypothetical protein